MVSWEGKKNNLQKCTFRFWNKREIWYQWTVEEIDTKFGKVHISNCFKSLISSFFFCRLIYLFVLDGIFLFCILTRYGSHEWLTWMSTIEFILFALVLTILLKLSYLIFSLFQVYIMSSKIIILWFISSNTYCS